VSQGFCSLVSRLAGKTGLQVLRKVKELKMYTKSIVMIAYPSTGSAVEAMKWGTIDYLMKPVSPDNLERPVR